jgi:hypothetical protein
MSNTRESVPGTTINNVKLYPNGSRSGQKTVDELATTGIQLRDDQIIEFAASILNMYQSGHREVNITCWLKKGYITFLGAPVPKEETQESCVESL